MNQRIFLADPTRLRFVLDTLPRYFARDLQQVLGHADTSGLLGAQGMPMPAALSLGIIRRRHGGSYLVELRFAPPPRPGLTADLGAILRPLLALPLCPAEAVPKDVQNPPERATGTKIRPRRRPK